MKQPTWQPVTITAKPLDERDQPIAFAMTPDDKHTAVIARIEIAAQLRAGFTPGLVVRELSPSELTESERAAFGFIGGVL